MARRRRKVGAWLVLVLAGPLLAFGLVSFARRIASIAPLTGIEWVQSSSGPLALSVEPNGPAAAAGLSVGDVLVEAEGRRIASALAASELAWSARDDEAMSLRVLRGGAEISLWLTPRPDPRPEPYAYLAIAGLAFWVSGVFIALQWPMIRGGAIYSLLSLAMFAQLTLSHSGRADALDRAIWWGDALAAALVPALLLHLGLLLAKRPFRRQRLIVAGAYGVSLGSMVAAVWLAPDLLGGAYRFHDPVLAVEARSRLEPLLLAVAWALTTGLLVRAYGHSSSVLHRSQMRWLLWGLSVGLGPFVALYALPWAVAAPELPGWAQFIAVAPIVLVPGAFTAALARYRLHDLDLILLRGIYEVAAVFGAFAVLAGSTFVLREGVGELIPLSRSASRYLGFFLAALLYPQLRGWTRAAVERAFYRKRYSYRTTLLDWARELNTETDLASLLERLRARVRDTLGLPRAEVLLHRGGTRFRPVEGADESSALDLAPDDLERLERHGALLLDAGGHDETWVRHVFAMRVKGRLRAVLAVAERQPPEEPLSTEDRSLLGTLAAHAATAIEAARLFQEVRRRADEIERLHARQATILESSAVGLLLLDRDGRIQAWNRALEALYGMTRTEAIGHRLAEVFPLHVVRRIEREADAVGDGEEARIFRLSMVNRDGMRVLVNLSISPVDRDGQGDGARVVTFDDVTERVKLEEQVLRQERLASLGLLAAGVAHEINTPLTGISSYAQMLLEDTPEDDPRRALLDKIETQTRRAAGITNSLLNLARPERTAFEALDLNRTVAEVLQLFEPQVRGSRIRIRSALAGDLPTIRGHRGKLQQVLFNLLINARDALEESGNITVLSYRYDDKVVVEIADDGTGIAEEDLSRIFDPFFTTKGRGKGTGLGLSVSYGIVQEHAGEILVESTPGQFTRFKIEIPLADSREALA